MYVIYSHMVFQLITDSPELREWPQSDEILNKSEITEKKIKHQL